MLPCHKGCAYQKEIPGDCHISCTFAWLKAAKEIQDDFPQCSSAHASRWFRFPFNFDPVWGPDACPAFAEQADPAMTKTFSPLESLAMLLR